ncbi:MAG: hypothetical protein HC853_12260 [Anaerolineae bacterium]|nr:hypothetical protein [Anaerolineae bacterium]
MTRTDDTPLVSLPKNAPEIPRKELLMAERELIGTYVSEHPLAASLQHFQDLTNRTSADITDLDNGQPIVVAGMVSYVRPHTSKAGKPMAFGALEDLTGNIELIIFPKTWEQYQDKIMKDKILVVWGKADMKENGSPKILVDRVSDSVIKARSADEERTTWHVPAGSLNARGRMMDDDFGVPPGYSWNGDDALPNADADDPSSWAPPMPETPDDWAVRDAGGTPDSTPINTPPRQNGKTTTTYAPKQPAGVVLRDSGLDDIRARLAAKPEVPNVFRGKAVDEDDGDDDATMPTPDPDSVVIAVSAVPGGVNIWEKLAEEKPTSDVRRPTSVSPTFKPANETLTVIITRCGNPRTDIERLEAAHQVLLSFKGQQRFNIKLKNGGARDAVIDFPNDTTRDCAELREKLVELLGADCVV